MINVSVYISISVSVLVWVSLYDFLYHLKVAQFMNPHKARQTTGQKKREDGQEETRHRHMYVSSFIDMHLHTSMGFGQNGRETMQIKSNC